MEICLHQWVRPKGPYTEVEGVGRCETCTAGKDNINCLKYYPITKPGEFELKEKEDAVH